VFLVDTAGKAQQVQVPTRSMLTNVYALDALVWAVGHEEVILHSSDAGHHWVRQHVNTDAIGPLLDIVMFDAQRGIAVGAEGTMLETVDGGTSWNRFLITDRTAAAAAAEPTGTDEEEESLVASDDIGFDETPPHLNAIVNAPQGLMIVGEGGAGYRSSDQGQSWTRFELPYTGSMFGAVALDDGSIIAFGLRGKAFSTRDLGVTWEELNTGTDAGLMGGAAVEGGRAVLVGGSGTILTKDSGNPNLKVFTYEAGGVLGGVLHQPGQEVPFIVVGENGIATFKPTAESAQP
jgi:photosystem II stability/assembly factor-like uncharacterized protein